MSNVLETDDACFDATVLQADRPVLVDFSATWCGPCKKLEPVVHEIAAEFEGRLKVVKVDVDRAPSSAARFAVLSVPTILLFDRGQVKDQVTGLVPKTTLLAVAKPVPVMVTVSPPSPVVVALEPGLTPVTVGTALEPPS